MNKLLRTLISASMLCVLSYSASAAVSLPMLDIQTIAGDSGATYNNASLFVDASALSIITAGDPIDIVDTEFQLNATFQSSAGSQTTYSNGTLSVGSLVLASFDSLTLMSFGNGTSNFFADVTFPQ